MKSSKLFSKFKTAIGYEMPFFIFSTVTLVGIGVWSVLDSPALRSPARLIPFLILMPVHIVLYWVVGFLVEKTSRVVVYLIVQGGLAFALNLLGQNIVLILSLYMAMIGISIGALRLTRWGVGFILFYLSLSLVNYVDLMGWSNAIWWAAAIFPTSIFVGLYVLLYMRQAEARENAQALLAELEGANRQLADYAARVEELTLANERQRMARELHDTLSQGLAGLILQLEAVQAHLGSGRTERAGAIIQQAMLQARATLADARRAIGDLRQAQPGERDLAGAVREETERFSAATGLPCRLEINLAAPTPPDLTEAVRRVVAEGLTNIARHARASTCQVVLTGAGGWLEARIVDDGVGFDPAAAETAAGHYGLLGMGERARLAGGTLSVTSRPGAGTTIILRLPIK